MNLSNVNEITNVLHTNLMLVGSTSQVSFKSVYFTVYM